MNPLTQVKNTQKATRREIEAGISDSASWHAKFQHSAYVFTGGLDYDLTEGDLLAVFAQYGEVVDLNLVRNKDTGKSMGFAFLAYEDQRSTVLAVDNLNGAKVAGRTIRVEHVDNYKKRKAEVGGGEQTRCSSLAVPCCGPQRHTHPGVGVGVCGRGGGRTGAAGGGRGRGAAAAHKLVSLTQHGGHAHNKCLAKGAVSHAARRARLSAWCVG